MKLLNLLEQRNTGYRPGQPYWEHLPDEKSYVVYDETGKELSRHTYQHVWDSSPAMRAANADLKPLIHKQYSAKKAADAAAAEAKPLSDLEKRYQELSRKVDRYNRYIYPKTAEDDILDKETRDIYIRQSTEWLNLMNRYANGGTIRKSLIDGTYKTA